MMKLKRTVFALLLSLGATFLLHASGKKDSLIRRRTLPENRDKMDERRDEVATNDGFYRLDDWGNDNGKGIKSSRSPKYSTIKDMKTSKTTKSPKSSKSGSTRAPAPTTSPAPSSFPSTTPSTSSAPSSAPTVTPFGPVCIPTLDPSPTDDVFLVDIRVLDTAFIALFNTLAVFQTFEALDKKILFVGSSLNSLVGGSIDAVLDLTDFVQSTISSRNGQLFYRAKDLQQLLKEYWSSYVESRGGVVSPNSSSCCDGTKGPVTLEKISGSDTIHVNFCSLIEFNGQSSVVNGTRLFDSVEECLELEIENATVVIDSQLKFDARLVVDLAKTKSPEILLDPLEASLVMNDTAELVLLFGLLDLNCPESMVAASASFEFTFCKADCPEDLIGRQVEKGASFYYLGDVHFLIDGVCKIGDPFPGLELSGPNETASIAISMNQVYSPDPVSQINVTGFASGDFLIFCPSDAILLLRAIDGTLEQTQKNEATDLNLPLTNITYGQTLQTGKVLNRYLFSQFLKVEEFHKRQRGSLWLVPMKGLNREDSLDNITEKTLEFYFIKNELTANPDDVIAIRSLASETNGVCTFHIDKIKRSSELGEAIRAGIQNDACDVETCKISDCMFTNTTDDDLYDIFACDNPDCDVVVDVDMSENVFIASVAYAREQGVGRKDVQLIGLYEELKLEKMVPGSTPRFQPPDGPKSLLGFPLNQPVTPGVVPRFRTFFDFAKRIEQTVKKNDGYENVTVAFSYVSAATKTAEPSRFEVKLTFEREASFNMALDQGGSPFEIGFNASAGLGDLKDIRLDDEESSTGVSVMAQYATELGVILAPNESEDIIIIGNACNGKNSSCVLDALTMELTYTKDDSTMTVRLELPKKLAASPNDELAKALAKLDRVAGVKMHHIDDFPSTLFVIRFDPSISHVLLSVPKDCIDPDTMKKVNENVLFCARDKKVQKRDNFYGIQDQDLSRRPFHISTRQASIEAEFEIDGHEMLFGTVSDTVEVVTNLSVSLVGNLSLSAGSKDFLPYNDWLIAITSVFQTHREGFLSGFLSVSSTFNSNTFRGEVKPLPPFDKIQEAVVDGGFVQPFDVNFFGKNSTPPVLFNINIPGCIRSLSYSDVVDSLSKAVKFIVGEGESHTVESCSGGLLGIELATYQIPIIGMSVCTQARFLQVLVDAVNILAVGPETPGKSTFASLETKLRTLLAVGEGKAPTVEITSNENELTLQLELGWTFQQAESLNIDLKEIIGAKPNDPFIRTLVPNNGDFHADIKGSVDFQLGLKVECNGTGISTYILGGTGLSATFSTSGRAQFDSSIGPLSGNVEGDYSVGDPGGDPLLLKFSLGNTSALGDPISASIGNLIEKLEIKSNGSLSAYMQIEVPFFDANATVNFTIPDLFQFIQGEPSGISLQYKPPGSIQIPSLFDLLLSVPDTFVDALDDVFKTIEAATFGSKGAITNLHLPFIRNGVGSALGANSDGNVFGRARRKMVFKLREALQNIGPFENDADSERVDPSINIADILQMLFQEIVKELDLSLGEDLVSVGCFRGDGNNVSCSDDKATSVMWTIPLGEEFEEELPLDFSLVKEFPFKVSLGRPGSFVPSLKVSWHFNLAFGFDQEEGFFLYTFPNENKSELAIEALLNVTNQDFKASLFYLTADMNGFFDLVVGASVFVDLVKGIEQPGLPDGRVTRGDFRRMRDKTSLFKIGALAGAALHAPNITLAFDGDGLKLGSIEGWIPELELELAAQFREEIGSVGKSDRAYVRRSRELLGHPAHGLLRSLAATDTLDILNEDFSFEPCPVNASVASACAKITNVSLVIGKVKDLVQDIAGKIANKDGNDYLYDVVKPLQELNKPLPGISDITQRSISVLDIAEIFIGEKKSGADTVRKLLKIYEKIQSLFEIFDQEGNLLLASECNLLDSFSCSGGLSDKKNSDRSTLGQQVLPSEPVPLNERRLECDTWDFECLKNDLAEKAGRVEGLEFPVLTNPVSILKLLQGEDIALVKFEPPKIMFAFEYALQFTLYTPPTVSVKIAFEFTAALEVGFELNTKGLREAIAQKEPDKALNSFALIDTFADGIDRPMITLTGGVFVGVSVRIAIIEVGVSGGVTFIATIDLFDPKPMESRGLVRPYELLTSGRSPLKWFEFTLQIDLNLRLYIKISIDLGFLGEVTLYKYSKTFTVALIPALDFKPSLAEPAASFDIRTSTLNIGPAASSDSNTRLLQTEKDETLTCTSLSGSLGEEVIECVLGGKFDTYSNVKQISSAISPFCLRPTLPPSLPPTLPPGPILLRRLEDGSESSGARNVTLIGVQSEVELNFDVNVLELNYEANGAELMNSIHVSETQVLAGTSSVTFQQLCLDNGKILLPRPEEQLLMTTLSNCDHKWELRGHSSLRVKANEMTSQCSVVADGGTFTSAQLIIDFGLDDLTSSCRNGNKVIITSIDAGDGIRHGRATIIYFIYPIVMRGDDLDNPYRVEATIDFGPMFNDIQIKMTDCSDEVIIEDLEGPGFISIYGGGDDDNITIGDSVSGLDKVGFSFYVDGGGGFDRLVVEDSSGRRTMAPKGQLDSGSLTDLDPDASFSIDFEHIEDLDISLGKSTEIFNVTSTPRESQTIVRTSADSSEIYIHNTQSDIEVFGGSGDDNVFVLGLEKGKIATVSGNAGDDALWVNGISRSDQNSSQSFSCVRWSGGEGNDALHAVFASGEQCDIEIREDLDGINTANIDCADSPCMILSRDNFIASVHNMSNLIPTASKITVDQNAIINAVVLRLNRGENQVYFDDTFAPMDVFGGPENDGFYIGQRYTSLQSADGLADLMTTTNGILSKGNSHPITINGNFGNDTFRVLRNSQVLDLNGDSGDDKVEIQSSLASSSGSMGIPDYVVNSLIDINGGTGEDSVMVIGTFADDSHVVTTAEILGGGLSVKYKAIEQLDVDGNDQLTVLSTDPDQVLKLLVPNKVTPDRINPLSVDPVISKNLRGHRGLIQHDISSGDSSYNNLLCAEGVAVNVLDNDGDFGYINVVHDEEFHLMSEDGLGDFSFSIIPTRSPNGVVAVDIIAPADSKGNRMLLLNGASTAAVTLIFESDVPQQVQVSYSPSMPLTVSDVDLMIKIVLNMAKTTDERFRKTKQSILPVDITLIPSVLNTMAKSVTIVKSDATLFVSEGANDGITATYDMYLRPCLTDTSLTMNSTLRIIESTPGQVRLAKTQISYDQWTSDEFQCKWSIQIAAVNDDLEEGTHFVTLSHVPSDPNGKWTLLSDDTILHIPDVVVRIYDNDVSGLIVRYNRTSVSTAENNGSLPPAEYSLRLTKQPANDTLVRVSLLSEPTASDYNTSSRVQVSASLGGITSVSFSPLDWFVWKRMSVFAVDDNEKEGVDYLSFPRLPFPPRPCEVSINIKCDGCEEPILPVICEETPDRLVMILNSGTCAQSSNIQSGTLFKCEDFSSGVANEGTVWVQARNLNGGGIYFNGPVNVGDMYVLDATSEPLGADTEILVTTDELPTGTLLQHVIFHTSCSSRNLFLKDRYGNSQVFEWENQLQGVVSCFREVTWSFSVFNSGTVDVSASSLVITINDEVFDRIADIGPSLILSDEWHNGTFIFDLDLSSRKIYNVKAEITAVDPERKCARCADVDEIYLDIGNPLPPGVPTAAPVNLPSITSAPSMAAGACSIDPQISCQLLNGLDCALVGLALVPAQERSCDTSNPDDQLLSLGWFYRSTNCMNGTTTQDIECMDFDGGPSSGDNKTAHITARGSTGILYLSKAVEPNAFVSMSNIPQPLDPAIVVTIKRGDAIGQVLQNFTMKTECNAVTDITLGKTFGALELARYRRNEKVTDSFIEAELGFSVTNTGTNNVELIGGYAEVNGVSFPRISNPGQILAPQGHFTSYFRYLILLLEPSSVKGTYVRVQAQGIPGQVECEADADPYILSIN